MSHIIYFEPSCYEEASSHSVWRDALTKEYQSIMKNDVWDIVLRPEGNFAVTSKWIYKTRFEGSIERHKTRFVVRGFSQVEGIDYEETFSSVGTATNSGKERKYIHTRNSHPSSCDP